MQADSWTQVSTLNCSLTLILAELMLPQSSFQAESAAKAAGWLSLAGSVPTAASICKPDGELAQTRAVPQHSLSMPREASGHASFMSVDTSSIPMSPYGTNTASVYMQTGQSCTQRCKRFFKTKLDWTHSPKGVGSKAASYSFYCFHSSAVPETGAVSDIIRTLLLCL